MTDIKNTLFAAMATIALAGCTDADFQRTTNYGQTGRVICWSGGKVRFDDFSTGRIEKHESSDGFYFVSITTNRLTEVTGDCDVDYGARPWAGFKAVR